MAESVQYSISDLAQYSGIKAPTIRMWEKRYNLFNPKRSCTNIRTYDNEELRKLINVQTLLQAGWKISKVVELDDNALDLEVKELMLLKEKTSCPEYLVNSMMVHMLSFDEVKFSKIIDQVTDQYGIKETVHKVIYPFLKKVGLLWQVNDISPAQEHFASAIIRRKMLSAIDKLKPETCESSKSTFILCLPPDEYHELPLMLSHYILMEQNIKTIYLGSSVPASVASTAAAKSKATHLFTVFLSNSPMEKLKDYLMEINQAVPDLSIYFSGCPAICQKTLINERIHHLDSIESFEAMVLNLMVKDR